MTPRMVRQKVIFAANCTPRGPPPPRNGLPIPTSPVAVRLLNDPSGMVRGSIALRQYFARGLETYPDLAFELLEVMWGISSVILRYKNQKGSTTGEYMELDSRMKVTRVVANYNS